METTPEMQQPRKRCSKCSNLKIMTKYGTKKNGGQFLTCITCRRIYCDLKDKTMKTEDTRPKKTQTMPDNSKGDQDLNQIPNQKRKLIKLNHLVTTSFFKI